MILVGVVSDNKSFKTVKNNIRSQEIKLIQINKLREQIYLMTNQGGNNTIPSDPNESFDN